jgi:RNA polymerase sigma-70 factor (ECF subfamily)
MAREVDERHEALGRCLKKLHPRDRELVLTRYEGNQNVEEAARRSGRTLEAAYRALNRIRKLLFDCVNQQLQMENAS